MNPLPSQCPICGGEITVTRIHCRNCDVNIEGRFSVGAFSQLNAEQIAFIESFVRNEGKLNRLEAELGLSYPTVRSRLHEVIRAMGYELNQEPSSQLSEADRRKILEDLDQGRISSEEAMRLLQG